MRVLVVEDERRMASVLRRGLVEDGFAVDVADCGVDALWLASQEPFDVVVLDLGLPDIDGLTVLRRLRSEDSWVPVLVLTARDAVPDRVSGLDLGADDYLTKPFAFPELLARLRALVRRGITPRPACLEVGDLRLDPGGHDVRLAGAEVHLTPTEFALLEYLMVRAGQVVPKAELLAHVRDFAFDGGSNVVEVHIGALRRKLTDPPAASRLETVRGVGYRLKADPAPG